MIQRDLTYKREKRREGGRGYEGEGRYEEGGDMRGREGGGGRGYEGGGRGYDMRGELSCAFNAI